MPYKINEDSRQRFNRYLKAQAQATPVRSTLESIYDYVAPNRVNFNNIKDSGDVLTQRIWNSTPIRGVRAWANQVQSILFPPFKRWYELEPGNVFKNQSVIKEDEMKNIKNELESVTESLFSNINQSNLYQVVNESFQDLAISTGVIAINECDGNVPFSFVSIPIDQIYFEEGGSGMLENFWRNFYIKARFIDNRWPSEGIEYPKWLSDTLKTDPDVEVELIEGVIKYPENDSEHKYLYYVQDVKTQMDLFTEWRSYSPFIGFRMGKRPNETYGWSVAYENFPTIRVLNLVSYYILKSAKFKAFPAYLATKSGALNPYTAIIEPGSIIPVAPDFYQSPPIMPLESGGDPNFAQLAVEKLEADLQAAFMINPLGDVQDVKNRSATEMNLRNQEWAQQNATGIGRMANELVRPLINSLLIIMRKKGLIKDIITEFGNQRIGGDDDSVWINFRSPLIGIQDEDDVKNLISGVQILTQNFGANAIASLNVEQIPEYIWDKLDLPSDLIKSAEEITQGLQQLQQQAQQPGLAKQKLEELAGEQAPQQSLLPPGEL